MRCAISCTPAGELAQMEERPLCMREVPGSIPGFSSTFFWKFQFYFLTRSRQAQKLFITNSAHYEALYQFEKPDSSVTMALFTAYDP